MNGFGPASGSDKAGHRLNTNILAQPCNRLTWEQLGIEIFVMEMLQTSSPHHQHQH